MKQSNKKNRDENLNRTIPGWVIFLSEAGGLGRFPVAPGTIGSLGGILLYILISKWPWWADMLFIYALFFIGAAASERYSAALAQKDPGRVVIDEVVGMIIALLSFPATGKFLLAGFLLFRFFDILKPPPANIVDRRMDSGYGIMLDDVFAGLYANLCLQAARSMGWL